MKNFKYLINDISSQIFYAKKVTSGFKEPLEKAKGSWEQLKDIPGLLSNDLKYIGDNLLTITFKDYAIISKYIDEFTYLIKTLKPEDTLKIRAIEEMRVKIVRLSSEYTIIVKTILAMAKELNLACRKELERRSKGQKNN
ncbi:hypothetical protein ACJDU8_25420 [Clostridium sp. WILCCON 0269]|uniref:Uncharacterized protein n=1 Tax=Candidatus Clostridium eludens TaxID=3381663 RepID=A0ABW8SS10_9CLOT